MAFTRDFDDTAPIDHTLNSQWPTKIRNWKTDVADRLSAIISGFVSGETVKGILALPFIAVTKPATISNQVQLYGKDVSGKTELHAVDEDGNEIQITNAGALNTTPLATILNTVYPIGFVVTLGVSTNPATLFGIGTWTAIAGKVIVGINAGDAEFDTLDETGGAKTVTLDATMIPAHDHRVASGTRAVSSDTADYLGNANCAGFGANLYGPPAESVTWYSQDGAGHDLMETTGGGGAHNNLQPYIVKYVWQRTA